MAERKALARCLTAHLNDQGKPATEASWAVHNIVSRHTERGETATEKISIALKSCVGLCQFKNSAQCVIDAGGWEAVTATLRHHATEDALVALGVRLLTFLVPLATTDESAAAVAVTKAMTAFHKNLELQMVRGEANQGEDPDMRSSRMATVITAAAA